MKVEYKRCRCVKVFAELLDHNLLYGKIYAAISPMPTLRGYLAETPR